jgi:hypothetical protein
MRKTGFLVKVSSKGRQYFYLRRSYWINSVSKNKNIYSFGSRESAIKNLCEWKNDISKMPETLKNMGYDINDVLNWIEQIERK